MAQIARPREGNQLGGAASTAPSVLPIITAAPGVRSKIAAIDAVRKQATAFLLAETTTREDVVNFDPEAGWPA